MTTNLDKKPTVYTKQRSWKMMKPHEEKKSQVFYADTYHPIVFRSKKTVTAKLLWGYLIHDTEMIPFTSKALARLCLTSLCIKWVLLLVWMTDSSLAVPWVWLVQLNKNKNVFCTTNRWHKAGLFFFKKNQLNSILQTCERQKPQSDYYFAPWSMQRCKFFMLTILFQTDIGWDY